MKNKNGYFIFLFFIIIILFQKLLAEFMSFHGYGSFLKIELVVMFVVIYIYVVKKSGPLGTYSIFLATSFIFLYSRIVLDIFKLLKFEESVLFSRIVLNDLTVIIVIECLLFSLLFSFLAFLMFFRKSGWEKKISTNTSLEKISMWILFILAPLVILDASLKIYFVSQYGYLSLFDGLFVQNPVYRLLGYVSRSYIYLFYVFLSSHPTKANFKKTAGLFILITLLDMLAGKRGEAMILLLIVLWYNFNFYNGKIKLNQIILAIGSVVVFSQLTLMLRSGFSNISFLDGFLSFFELNGMSIYVLGYVVELRGLFVNEGLPYFLSPIYDLFLRILGNSAVFYQGNTLELLESTNYLGRQLTYFINPGAYLNGHGTGTSYIAEFYDFGGLVGVAGLSFLVIVFVLNLENMMHKNRFYFMVFLAVLYRFIYMPRDSLLRFLSDLVPMGVIYISIVLITHILLRTSSSNRYKGCDYSIEESIQN
ncbi:O-antigen polysaccharide polymerase Wzy [Candidatus Contubernalis alkaliaceticus]|uniref:O-antigen polysaccharide polymerase Wzy n=1 Tax=Candidatus Contubernalis alkaliaceticus TaxID=338645 RepID=UPI001F4C2CAC|nr:O-antigen polysaccharide polymerase Wzy [Candidatus Contubernalis alkalaceticus]UNC93563.1 O-antigen polysaccharide polymerase Wzy [Candidatus Contubernalis alkalaceticus]